MVNLLENFLSGVQTRCKNEHGRASSFREHAIALICCIVFHFFLSALFSQIICTIDWSFLGLITNFNLFLSRIRKLILY
jgi:diacylglycerol kinase